MTRIRVSDWSDFRFGRAVGKGERRRPKQPKPITLYQPCNIDRQIQQPALPVRLRPDSRCFGYGPLDEKPRHHRSNIVTQRSQLGPIGQALADTGCCEISYEPVPGKRLQETVARLRAGDTFVVFDAVHASGCSVSALRKLRREVEARGAKFKILRVRSSLFLDWQDCEKRIHRACIDEAKKNGRYKAGPGREPKLQPAEVQRLKALGFTNEEIADRLGFSYSQVCRVVAKLKAAQTKAA